MTISKNTLDRVCAALMRHNMFSLLKTNTKLKKKKNKTETDTWAAQHRNDVFYRNIKTNKYSSN